MQNLQRLCTRGDVFRRPSFGASWKGLHSNDTALFFILALMAFLLAVPAQAKEEGPITTRLTAYKITRDSKGIERHESADAASPGDVIEYQAFYKNEGTSSVRNLAGKLPIPEGMTYIPGTDEPAPDQASVNGNDFEKFPLKRKVRRPDGTEAFENVPYAEYRALQWELGDVAVGEEKQVRTRVRLNTD